MSPVADTPHLLTVQILMGKNIAVEVSLDGRQLGVVTRASIGTYSVTLSPAWRLSLTTSGDGDYVIDVVIGRNSQVEFKRRCHGELKLGERLVHVFPDKTSPPTMVVRDPGAGRPPTAAIPRPSSDPSPPRTETGPETSPVETRSYTVWFGTNRQPFVRRATLEYSCERASFVSYGTCKVAVPKSHKIGSLGSPWWKRLLTLSDDRLKVIELLSVPPERFWPEMATSISSAPVDERDAVVFLHGYNVAFEDAALRAAQIGFDLGIQGCMAFYSWPSQGTLQGYPADEASIEASEQFISEFLIDIAQRSGASRVHLIAHSMGNRGLLRAVDRIAATAAAESKTPFSQIILAAADVDQDTFKRLCVAYSRVAERTTMYVCAKDRAVEASAWLHDFPRAGLTPPVLVVPGIDTINVSNLDLSLLGHGYVAEARELLTDMHDLIRHGTPPEKRFGLRRERAESGEYWVVGA